MCGIIHSAYFFRFSFFSPNTFAAILPKQIAQKWRENRFQPVWKWEKSVVNSIGFRNELALWSLRLFLELYIARPKYYVIKHKLIAAKKEGRMKERKKIQENLGCRLSKRFVHVKLLLTDVKKIVPDTELTTPQFENNNIFGTAISILFFMGFACGLGCKHHFYYLNKEIHSSITSYKTNARRCVIMSPLNMHVSGIFSHYLFNWHSHNWLYMAMVVT